MFGKKEVKTDEPATSTRNPNEGRPLPPLPTEEGSTSRNNDDTYNRLGEDTTPKTVSDNTYNRLGEEDGTYNRLGEDTTPKVVDNTYNRVNSDETEVKRPTDGGEENGYFRLETPAETAEREAAERQQKSEETNPYFVLEKDPKADAEVAAMRKAEATDEDESGYSTIKDANAGRPLPVTPDQGQPRKISSDEESIYSTIDGDETEAKRLTDGGEENGYFRLETPAETAEREAAERQQRDEGIYELAKPIPSDETEVKRPTDEDESGYSTIKDANAGRPLPATPDQGQPRKISSDEESIYSTIDGDGNIVKKETKSTFTKLKDAIKSRLPWNKKTKIDSEKVEIKKVNEESDDEMIDNPLYESAGPNYGRPLPATPDQGQPRKISSDEESIYSTIGDDNTYNRLGEEDGTYNRLGEDTTPKVIDNTYDRVVAEDGTYNRLGEDVTPKVISDNDYSTVKKDEPVYFILEKEAESLTSQQSGGLTPETLAKAKAALKPVEKKSEETKVEVNEMQGKNLNADKVKSKIKESDDQMKSEQKTKAEAEDAMINDVFKNEYGKELKDLTQGERLAELKKLTKKARTKKLDDTEKWLVSALQNSIETSAKYKEIERKIDKEFTKRVLADKKLAETLAGNKYKKADGTDKGITSEDAEKIVKYRMEAFEKVTGIKPKKEVKIGPLEKTLSKKDNERGVFISTEAANKYKKSLEAQGKTPEEIKKALKDKKILGKKDDEIVNDKIRINTKESPKTSLEGASNSAIQRLKTLSHELTHKEQTELVRDKAAAERLGLKDDRKLMKYGSELNDSKDLINYRTNPIEKDAFSRENAIKDKLEKGLEKKGYKIEKESDISVSKPKKLIKEQTTNEALKKGEGYLDAKSEEAKKASKVNIPKSKEEAEK
ncbi:MAG: hypothetical protein Q7K48_07445 [Fusobacterium sp. JB021]|nr:hypothetical protein [Fusobacterium sp. JB021]